MTALIAPKAMMTSSVGAPAVANLYLEKLSRGVQKNGELGRELLSREIELQYLVPHKLGDELRRGHPPVQLTTHYFPKKAEIVQGLVKALRLTDLFCDADELTSARLRECVATSGVSEYWLEFKGKKGASGLERLSRPEVSVQISKRVFIKMLPNATGGTTIKSRFSVPGEVFAMTGERTQIFLQLDQVQKAGAPARFLEKPLYRADIEISHTELAIDIRSGRTTFSNLLSQCIELSSLPKEKTEGLTYTALARRGYTSKAHQTLIKLLGANQK